MDKINFTNLPDQTTPVNSSNMNLLQTNVDNAKIEKANTLTNVNLDNLDDTEVHYCNGVTNGPDNEGNGWVVVIKYSANYIKQLFFPLTTNTSYERVKSTTWGEWVRVGGEKEYALPTLSNNWSANGYNKLIRLPNGVICLTLSVRNGTSTEIMTLDTNFRPTQTIIANASNGSTSGFITISTAGVVTVSNNIFTSGSSNCICSVIYS